MEFRLARPEDAAELLAIYKPYVEKTAITFEYEVPSLEAFEARIKSISALFPYIVAVDEESGKIQGYAYAGRYRERKAYDWVVELSIYLAEEARGKGLGKPLYHRLLKLLTALNYQRAYACITVPNPGSIHFHEKLGFSLIGQFNGSGYKFEQWYGIAWMELVLQEEQVKPVLGIADLDWDVIARILRDIEKNSIED
ncbi:GNAT family N-acetyltransferase [Lactococcus termiticola]|uniref:Phosphinothricin N-acetyltransferase n=1 Tax=Lactococcus termiticola TaxID=2169526 RepID=A0A2R5HFQ6_9LACT|nr:GNAT family N-acetyltransferase [Lactococcus termiticola]GBG96666.1 phosphinothricin N-acetyltransferase [Lactococcus termiticola]